jgi:hypothetical protein
VGKGRQYVQIAGYQETREEKAAEDGKREEAGKT